MPSSSAEKTEQPTQRRIRDARRKGQVATSRDLTAAVAFLASVAGMSIGFRVAFLRLQAALASGIGRAFEKRQFENADVVGCVSDAMWHILWISLPVCAAAMVVGTLVAVLQTRGLFSTEPLSPKLERLNPVEGFKRFFGVRPVVEFGKTWGKIVAATGAAFSVLVGRGAEFGGLTHSGGLAPLMWCGSVVESAAFRAGLVLVLVGAADVLIQKKLHIRDHRMTKDEVKRDHKEDEGDPHIRHARRQIHRELTEREAVVATHGATLVLLNPTHLAVALRYDPLLDSAPRVVAKGSGKIAKAIRSTAERDGIAVVRNKKLARALFGLPMKSEIPETLYVAIAEILAFVTHVTETVADDAS